MAILDVDMRSEDDAKLRTGRQSQSDRCSNLNTSRQTVNTHNSILDMSRDEEEDEEVKSVLFESLTVVSMDSSDDENASKGSSSTKDSKKFSLHRFLGEGFMDGLCTPDFVPGGPCVVPTDCTQRFNCTRPRRNSRRSRRNQCDDRVNLSSDILDLLGCSADPGSFEREEIWHRKLDLSKPTRANLKNRMRHIRELRNSAHRSHTSSRHGVTLSNSRKSGYGYPSVLKRSATFNEHDPLAKHFGKGMQPIVPDYDGYDSDPEVLSSQYTPRPRESVPVPSIQTRPSMDEDMYIQDLVQQTMNSTWTFTWHPNPHNVKEFGLESVRPICINIWIERGTALPNGHVAEPTIMWRDAYQPFLTGKSELNKSTQKPWTMRLLSTCRIAASGSLDRSIYPLARSQNCFVLKTSSGNHEFLFESTSSNDMRKVCQQWKLTVARFASLAVMEDIASIEREFFHPSFNNQMLTIDSSSDEGY
ncbi:MAG: hypothetical protein SGBAC_002034 [Bacillariaceae sp.]